MLENFLVSLQFILQWESLILITLATLLGLIFGSIPGLTATLAIVLLLPLTFGMEPALAMAVLGAIYVGGISGGQVAAILLNMPGTPDSIATTYDGYPMARNGEPGRALSYGIIASFIGTVVSVIALATVAPLLGMFALKFQVYEYFLLGVFGLTIVAGLAGRSFLYGAISALFGLLIAAIGADPLSGTPRFTFGISQLDSGIELLPAMIGLFVIAEIYNQITQVDEKYVFKKSKIGNMKVTLSEILVHWKNLIRSSLLGISIGILPGAGGTIANFLSYDLAKKSSKHPEKFGTGIPDGIVASEASNNAVVGGSYVPMLALGIPGNTVTAILLAGLTLHGLTPGPTMFTEQASTVYSIILTLLLSAIIMVVLMYSVMIRFFTWSLRIPKTVLLPIVIVMATIGTYNLRFNFNDLWVLLIFSFIGFFLLKMKFPITPMILGLILGPLMEKSLRSAMMSSGGSILPFFTRPISLGLIVIILVSVGFSFFYARLNAKKEAEMRKFETEIRDDLE